MYKVAQKADYIIINAKRIERISSLFSYLNTTFAYHMYFTLKVFLVTTIVCLVHNGGENIPS